MLKQHFFYGYQLDFAFKKIISAHDLDLYARLTKGEFYLPDQKLVATVWLVEVSDMPFHDERETSQQPGFVPVVEREEVL